MATVLLVRHGRSTANTSGVLAGLTPGVALDDTGRGQASALAERMAGIRLAAAVTSPLQRCRETLDLLLAPRPRSGRRGSCPDPVIEDRLVECDYGDWTGRALKDLVRDPLWRAVQDHPSSVVFPGGEAMAAMQQRAVAAVREHDREVTRRHGAHAVWVAVSHGDVIKAIVADALGAHLDTFQRITVDPASVSVVRYTQRRPFVVRVNDTGGELAGVVPPRRPKAAAGDAEVGGGAGAGHEPADLHRGPEPE